MLTREDSFVNRFQLRIYGEVTAVASPGVQIDMSSASEIIRRLSMSSKGFHAPVIERGTDCRTRMFKSQHNDLLIQEFISVSSPR